MAAITLTVGSASGRGRVLKTRRSSEVSNIFREAANQRESNDNIVNSRPRVSPNNDNQEEEEVVVVGATETSNLSNQTNNRIDQQQKISQSNEQRASRLTRLASTATGDNINKSLERGTLIGGLIRSRQGKPVGGPHNHTDIGHLNANERGQVKSHSEIYVNRSGLKSILKEHQTGTLADKTERRTSHSAASKQQESDEKNQRPVSVDDNRSERGNSSAVREDIESEQDNRKHQHQQRPRRDTGNKQAGESRDDNLDRDNEDEDQANWSTGGRGKRPPTFGTTPYKLSRLPYYSYYGKARNVELVNRVNQEPRVERDSQSVKIGAGGESSGRSSASLSQHSLSSLSSHTGERKSSARANWTSRVRDQSQERSPYRESSGARRGYSNISNLFPGGPTQVRRPESRAGLQQPQIDEQAISRKHSTSLSNLTQQKRGLVERVPNLVKNKALGGSQGEYLDRNSSHVRRMRRQNSSLSGRPISTRYNGVPTQHRSTSAFGGHSLSQYHRSPSAMSLMYGGSTGGSPVYGGLGPIDPDCPVHGYSPLGATMSKSTQQLNTLGSGFVPPEADLLYEAQPAGLYTERVVRDLYPTSSPSQPLLTGSHGGATLTKRQASGGTTTTATGPYLHGPPTSPYYNGPNRFSLYHSMGNDFGTRTSLAPPNEQVRRILGYQPQSRPVHLHPQWAYSRPFIHLQDSSWRSPSPTGPLDPVTGQPQIKPVFMAYNQLQDTQAVRAIDFHPSGEVYAVGSNSRVLRICAYPADYELRHYERDRPSNAPRVLFKFLQVHRGSIYCVQFNATGQLLATGSNDQTVHIARYNSTTHCPDGDEFRLTMHDGTVRDLCFIDDSTNGSALLLSAGGGDNKIYVTDCDTITPFQSMTGHTQTVMSLHHWGGANFVSASLDKSIRFWDLRTRSCTSIVSALPLAASQPGTNHKWAGPGAPVCAVKVDPSGRLMASGHSDSTCMLYDIRGARIIQSYKPHDDEVRTLSFSPKSYYLLSGGYDGRIMLTDLQGDLSQPLPTCCVAECDDKIVQAKWHPSDFTFVTTSADKTATLWALPTE